MKDLMFFDAACGVGDTITGPRPGVAALLAEMDRCGVDRALVKHNGTASLGAENANEKICQMLGDEDPERRLTGVWYILPTQCGELPEPDAFFAAMKESRARAISLDPYAHRYVACRLTIGKYLDTAQKLHVPVLLDCFSGKWNELYAFLQEFPDLLCIFHGGEKWGNDRYIRPLLEAYPNSHLEYSGYWVPEGLRDLAEKYGAERLLFGSSFPRYNQGSAMLQLKQSGLDPDDIARIAGKNLEQMLSEALS